MLILIHEIVLYGDVFMPDMHSDEMFCSNASNSLYQMILPLGQALFSD